MNQVQWRHGEDGEAIPWVKVEGSFKWVPYYQIPGHRPDSPNMSKGYPAFVQFLKQKYVNVPMERS
jgi:hypothetical protein